MRWDLFYEKVRSLPVIETRALQLLFAQKGLEVQLIRWQKQGKILQLKRGYYVLQEKYRQVSVFEPSVAAILKSPSYISLEKALEMHHLIPDAVFAITSVTTGIPVSSRASAKIFKPASFIPWNEYGEVRGL